MRLPPRATGSHGCCQWPLASIDLNGQISEQKTGKSIKRGIFSGSDHRKQAAIATVGRTFAIARVRANTEIRNCIDDIEIIRFCIDFNRFGEVCVDFG